MFHGDPIQHYDAFTLPWGKFYSFPPFSLIHHVLQKVNTDIAQGLIVVPFWTNQPWFPLLLRMLIEEPLIIPSSTDLLYLPSEKDAVHPIWENLNLLACKISGDTRTQGAFRLRLRDSSKALGVMQQRQNTTRLSRDGSNFAVDGVLIPFNHL